MKKLMFLIVFCAISIFSAQAQKTFSGKVIGPDGLGLPGVSVVEKANPANGFATDIDGNWTLTVPDGNSILQFTAIGMKTIEIAAKDAKNLKMLNDAQILDEVMVVGYGTTAKEAFTGSASTVKKDQLEKTSSVSVAKALQATTPGLQVASASGAAGTGATIRIRGIGSLLASADPLWVVDGVVGAPTPNNEDIETITVLKDAAASSIYGSRAANGVIMVTTKSGKAGRTSFDFQAKYSLSSRASKKFNMLNSADYYKVSWQGLYAAAIKEGKNHAEAAAYAHSNIEAFAGRNPYDVAQPYDDNGNLVAGAKLMIDEDWYDLVNQTGKTQQYDLSANGGNEKTKFYYSLGYYDQEGIVKPNFYTRYSGQVSVTNKVNKKLEVGFKANVKRVENQGLSSTANGSSTGYAGFTYPNNVSLYELNDKFEPVLGEDKKPLYNWVNKVSQNYNPIGLSELDKFNYNATTTHVSTNLKYNILKNLIFNTNFSATYYSNKSNHFQTKEYGDAVADKGRSQKDNEQSLKYISSTTLAYDKIFDNKHHINALLGYEFESYEYTSLQAIAKGYEFNFSDELSVGTDPKSVASGTLEQRMVGLFSRLNYDYNSKYYASFSVRRDASSKFAPDKRWGTFWSASASWRINQEDFMKDVDWVNNLKLKFSHGSNGNAGIPAYLFLPLYSLKGNYYGKTGLVHSQLANSKLRWEKNIMTNIGLEFGLFGFLDGSIEWFSRASDDLLFEKPLPYSTGWSTRTENVGGMKNTGIEFNLNSTNISNDDFQWTTNFNISRYKNKITSLSQEEIVDPSGYGGRVWRVGGDAYTWYLRDFAGVNKETGAAQWYQDVKDDNGNITKEITEDYAKATRYELGSSLPDFYGALNNEFTYKNLSLGIQLYFNIGGKIYDNLEQTTMNDGSKYGQQLNAKVLDAWRPDNKDSNIPQFIHNNTSKSNSTSDRFLYDGSFLRIRNINLSYMLPQSYTDKVGLQHARVFVNMENLYTFTKYEGLDPEQGISGLNGFSTIPNVRTITFGLRLGF